MANNRAIFKSGYHKLLESLQRRWQEQGESETIEQLVTRGMQAYRFNNEISDAQLTEIEMQLKIDLTIYMQSIEELTNPVGDPQQLAIEDTLWSWLVAASDKNQLEWSELQDDLEHKGLYNSHDIIGLGRFICSNCKHQVSIYHPQEIGSCIECNGTEFTRAPLKL